MAGGRLWTTLEERKLVEMVEQGIKYSVIGKRLNRSYGSIHGRVSRYRLKQGYEPLPKLHKPGELIERVKTLCIPGVPDRVVGEILGVTRTMIRTTRKRLGIPNQCEANKKFPRDISKTNLSNDAKVLWLYSGVGKTTTQIANILNLPYFIVQYCLQKYELEVIRKTEYIHPKEQEKIDRKANKFKPRVYSIGTR